jgi:hypothetical protein
MTRLAKAAEGGAQAKEDVIGVRWTWERRES